jgi:polysaccharide chain length determinant protein (PEP-CTERM system associated)
MELTAPVIVEQVRLLGRGVWNRRWLALLVALGVGIVLAVVVSMIPNRYQADARVYVNTQTVLKPLMAGLAYQPDIEQQVRMLARTLISRPNLEEMLQRYDFGWPIDNPQSRERLITDLLEKIKVEGGGASNLYVVRYRDASPERARRVVEAIVDLFMHSSSGEQKRDAQDASEFINAQIKEYEGKLSAAENRLKDYKVRNFSVTGVQSQDYFGRMSALSDQVNKLRIDLHAAEQSRDAYRRELAAEEPQIPVQLSANLPPPIPSEIDVRLETQRKQLDELLRRFTEAHPDVIGARRIIAQLEAQRKSEEVKTSGVVSPRASAPTSPVYQRIRIAAADAEAQVASLRSQLSAQQSQLEQIRAVASRVPQAESELAQLNRDYDVVRKNYELLVSRRESASLGVKLDESAQLADFRVIEPPHVLPSPVFPGRTHLAAMAVLASLFAGVAAAAILQQLRPTFHEVDSLRALSGRPVLGSVSVAMAVGGEGDSRLRMLRFSGAVATLLLMQILWLVWISTRPPL